jgi:hypothetical protein
MENLLWFFMVFLLAGLGYFLYSRKGQAGGASTQAPAESPLLAYLRNDAASCSSTSASRSLPPSTG